MIYRHKHRQPRWHRWWAWHPVRTLDNYTVWLEPLWRYRDPVTGAVIYSLSRPKGVV